MKDRALAAFVWFCIIGLLVGVATAATAVVLLIVESAESTDARPADDVQEAELPAEGEAAGEDGGSSVPEDAGEDSSDGTAGEPSDGKRSVDPCSPAPRDGPFERLAELDTTALPTVDATQIYPKAKALARQLEPAAVLRFISADHVSQGRVDVTRHRISFVFEYQRFGPTGRETGLVEVVAGCSRLHAKQKHNVAIYRHNQYDPVPDPGCSMERAWLAAVQTGLPRDAEVRMIYRDDDIMKRGSPILWSITQDGQPNRRRDVHGQSCRLYRTYQSGAPVIVETYAADAGLR